MHSMKHMIELVMDGVRDTNMIASYAEEARKAEDSKSAAWFATRAKERLGALRRDWTDVEAILRMKDGDMEIVDAMSCYLHKEIERLRDKVERM